METVRIMQSNMNRKINKLTIYKMISRTILWAFLITIAGLTVFPVVMTLLGSFKTNAELTAGATILPREWHIDNYFTAWKQANFARYTWNSLFMSTAATIGTVLVASMAAYVVDRKQFWGRRLFVLIQSATMFITIGAVVLRPQFELMVDLNLNTSLWGVILILISAHASTFFIILGFLKGVPRDLDEAAVIDGCSFLSIYWKITLPLLKPGLAVTALFAFRHAWNEYILPLVFTMTQPELQPLTVGLVSLRYGTTAATQSNLMMAGACLSILPILVVYLFANKSFMQVTAGAIKG